MDNNKFFTWVWRVNGIVILIGSLIIALFISYQLIQESSRDNYPPHENIVESVAEDPHNLEKWILGRPSSISGSNYIMIPLVSENKKVKTDQSFNMFSNESKYFSKSTNNPAKNILFLNSTNNTSFWLFEDTQRLILRTSQVPDTYMSKEPTQAIFYNVVSKDSNNDKVLDQKDDLSLFISSPTGTDYQLVLNAYDKIISKEVVEDNRGIIIYQFEGVAYSMLIQISPYKVISNEKLPKIIDNQEG